MANPMAPTVPPPAPDPLVALADRCVQCGLCLPACPTYGHDRQEAESARGRIALARAWALGLVAPTPGGDAHIDHCLGCRSCEAVCPSEVEYGRVLILARTRQRARRGTAWRQRVAERLAARPRVLDLLLAVYRRIHAGLPRTWRVLPKPPPTGIATAPVLPASAPVAALFVGCIARPYEPGLRDAVVRLCAALEVRVEMPAAQGCCGALHAHAGDPETADRLAAVNRKALARAATVLTVASGCHEAVAHALEDTADTQDAIAFLAARAGALRFRETHERVALHLPCTQRNVVRSVAALRTLLARVPGLEVIELTAGYGCCGAAGTQWLADPARAAAYRQPLLDQFAASGATRLLSANIGCRLHFANATARPVLHPLEFLASRLGQADRGCRAAPPPVC